MSNSRESKVSRITIDSGWKVREEARAGIPEHRRLSWLPAQVPGHVHTDLMRAGVIPDPFVRMHERDVEWVDETDWTYETRFDAGDPSQNPGHRSLLFHGLDTVAEVALNGKPIGRADNMYVPHRFDIDDAVASGENVLRVTFLSARRIGAERKRQYEAESGSNGYENWDAWGERSFVRKAQYMYGWDWGPVLRSAGIWQPVQLVTVPSAEILEWKVASDFTAESDAIQASVTAVVRRSKSGDQLALSATIHDEDGAKTLCGDVPAEAGTHTITLPALSVRAQRWQPIGYGAQARYRLSLSLGAGSDGTAADTVDALIGFRAVELVQEPDSPGGEPGFLLRVNGVDLFAKGANWIPDDSFAERVSPAKLRERLTQARDANFNMLRIWGGGLYESELFYDICDELGLLVWQDFPYACAYYPDDGAWGEAARSEAAAAVKRIRNHPSLALWCGNNETDTMYEDGWGGSRPLRYYGEKLYRDILPAVVAEHDPETPYWASSPSGGAAANSDKAGDCHNWDVWHGRGDWTHYTENDARFCSEFGFASSCGMDAWDACIEQHDKDVYGPVVRWHDKTRKDYDVYLGMIALHYPAPRSLEEHVYFSQCNQADAMKFGVEHYRRRKGHCWGTLIWQLNDCWPVQSWAMIDSLGEPKAAYYAAKKFYAPVLVSLLRTRGSADGRDLVKVAVVSDRQAALQAKLTLTLVKFDGEVLHSKELPVSIAANSTATVGEWDLAEAAGKERSCVVHAALASDDGSLLSENFLLLAEPKELELLQAEVRVEVQRSAGNQAMLTLLCDRFAPYTWLRSGEGPRLAFSDNFVHLLPGVPKTVVVTCDHPDRLEIEPRDIVVRTLVDLIGRTGAFQAVAP